MKTPTITQRNAAVAAGTINAGEPLDGATLDQSVSARAWAHAAPRGLAMRCTECFLTDCGCATIAADDAAMTRFDFTQTYTFDHAEAGDIRRALLCASNDYRTRGHGEIADDLDKLYDRLNRAQSMIESRKVHADHAAALGEAIARRQAHARGTAWPQYTCNGPRAD